MKKTIMIAGGGTGGHIYPAIAIGRALMKQNVDIDVRFVGTAEGLETKIMQRENLNLDLISSGKLNFSGRWLQKMKTLFKIPIGFLQSVFLILKFKPVYVIGVGGYASAPFLLCAALMGRKTALWEPNAHPGLANRILSRFISRAYLVFGEGKKYLKSKDFVVLGMPLREEIEVARESLIQSVSRNENGVQGRSEFESLSAAKTTSDKLNILCFGGSQGSLFLNRALSDFILQNPELQSRLHVIHQTGAAGFDEMKKKYGDLKCVEVFDYIYDMPKYYKVSDVQFCRGGASTIAEAAAFGVVPIVVPLPAADNHQLRNAEAVVKAEAGFLFEQDQFSPEKFKILMIELLENKDYRAKLAANLKKMAPVRAADKIAKDILENL